MPKKLSHEEASEIMLANDLVPHEAYPGNRKPWLCRHTVCGRLVEPRRDGIVHGGGGCKFCSGNAVEDPAAVMLAAGLTPLTEYPGPHAQWLCRHEVCGRDVTPRRKHVVSGLGGCKFCAGQAVDDPAAVMLAAGLTPLTEYPGHHAPWLCRHEACGRDVTPTRSSITHGNGGCAACGGSGYNPSKTGYFYIVLMPDLDLTGFGISNDPERRLGEYRREGTADGFDAVFSGTGQEIAVFEATLKAIVKELGEVDMSRPDGFKTESLAGDWCTTLWDRAKRAGLTVIA